MFQSLKKYCPKIVAMAVGAAFLLHMGVVSAGTSTLHPGVGKGKPKTPDYNVEQSKDDSTYNRSEKKDNSVKKIDRKKGVSVTMLDVMLGEGLSTATATADSAYKLVDTSTGKEISSLSANATAKFTIDSGYIAVNGKKTSSRSILLQANSNVARVKYGGAAYSGALKIVYNGSSLQVLNNVSLEDYVKGVLPSEMSPSWHSEALKAQAVAARTFALYSKGTSHGASSGYDLCSSTHCQVYGGVSDQTDATNQAVDATYGQVMQYKGQVIYAAFHASSGGATENSENVWGSYLPYLRSVIDDDSKSPYHNWTVKFTVDQVQKKLSSASKGVGTLQSISMDSSSSNTDTVTGRSASGRSYSVKFTGSSGTVTLTGEQVRSIFGLKSAMFNVRTEKSVAASSSVKKNSSKTGGGVASTPNAMRGSTIKISGSEQIIFDGHGFGHGLGMAQYGAEAMAESSTKYNDILGHYYTDVVIQEIY